jgi:hypothetical protein
LATLPTNVGAPSPIILIMSNHVHGIVIIHDEREMDAIWRYIESNPLNWDNDNETPSSDRSY